MRPTPYEITSRYEWGPDTLKGVEIYPAPTDRGRTTKTSSEFTLKIDPKNFGVMLRRKLDYQFPNQRAEVFVPMAGETSRHLVPRRLQHLRLLQPARRARRRTSRRADLQPPLPRR